jgi:predicted lipoprotein with Yx(FWY)xxD motif
MSVSTRRRTAFAGVFGAAAVLALAACGSSSGSGSSAPASASASSSAAGGASTPSAATAAGVHTTRSATLGTIVVDGKGMTLYRFDMDTNKPSASHCTGQCAALWPAAPAASASSAKGVDQKLLGSIDGTGGGKQLTLDGWPLYTYAQDSKAGDTSGQGVGGTWWAVTPSGGKAAATSSATSSPTTSASTSGGSYGY